MFAQQRHQNNTRDNFVELGKPASDGTCTALRGRKHRVRPARQDCLVLYLRFDLQHPKEVERILSLDEPFLTSPEALQCSSRAAHRLACFAKKVAGLISELSRLAGQRLNTGSLTFISETNFQKFPRRFPGNPYSG